AIRVLALSSIYETEPVDYLDQAWFLNAVLEAQTDLAPTALLGKLQEIESRMGSKKAFAKGPRLIDLDILLYDDATVETPDLQIPTSRAATPCRPFSCPSRRRKWPDRFAPPPARRPGRNCSPGLPTAASSDEFCRRPSHNLKRGHGKKESGRPADQKRSKDG